MKIKTYKVKQYNSTYKHLLVVDGKPVLITESENRLGQCIAYLSDKRVEINDGKIKKILDAVGTEGIKHGVPPIVKYKGDFGSDDILMCPNCGNYNVKDMNYCPDCGQAFNCEQEGA